MEKLLNELRNNLLNKLDKISGNEAFTILKKNNDSLFLSVTEYGLKWQKKKIENLFESSSFFKESVDNNILNACIDAEYVSECLKPSKRDYYFINLNGLYYLESKKISNLKTSVIKLLQNNFYKDIKWLLKDEEKLIVSLLIIFNAFSSDSSFKFTLEIENAIWDFMKNDLASGLVEIGICNSFQEKIEAKSTKYASGKNFISGHPSILSRTGLFIPNNGEYHLELNTEADYLFLVDLLFKDLGYPKKLAFVELIENEGRNLFMKSILSDIFIFNEELRKAILH